MDIEHRTNTKLLTIKEKLSKNLEQLDSYNRMRINLQHKFEEFSKFIIRQIQRQNPRKSIET